MKKITSLFIALLAVFSLMNRFSRMERTIHRIVSREASPFPQYEVYATLRFDDRELEFSKEIHEGYSNELVIKEGETVHHNTYRFASKDFKQYLYFDWNSEYEVEIDGESVNPETVFFTSGNVPVSVYVFDVESEIQARKKEAPAQIVFYEGKECSIIWKEIEGLISMWEKVEMPSIIFQNKIASIQFNEYIYEFTANHFIQKEWTLTCTNNENYEDYIIVTTDKAQAYRLSEKQKEQLNQLLENRK